MDPVEIEILMKDGLSKGIDKSRVGVMLLLDASRRLVEVLRQSGEEGAKASDKYNSKIVGLRQGVEQMSASLKALGVSEKDTAGLLMKSSEQNMKIVEAQAGRLRSMEGMLRSALESGNTALVETTKQEMEQVETRINKAFNTIQKNAELIPTIVNKASSKVPEQQTESMRAQLRLLTNEIASTTVEYRRMTDAERNSAAGMELKRKLEDLIKKAGELRDAMDDANTQIRGEASDTKHLDGIAQGLNVVTSSAGAAVSVSQMFGASQEDLINIQTKLQATLAISNALTVIQNNLQKESSLMMGIRTVQEKAQSAAISIRTAAEGRGIIVTKAATIAQAAFNLVAKANPYVLLATAILTVVGALVAFTTGSKEATAAEKRQREEGERLRKQQEDMSHALGQAAGDMEAKYRSLQQQWNHLKTESEKNEWIKENANTFHELGLNVSSVADAEQVLVDMAPQVIAALKAVAEAEAYSDLYRGAIKKRAEKWEHRAKSRETGDFYTTEKGGNWVSTTVGIPQEWRDAGLSAGDYESRLSGQVSEEARLTQSGIDKINKYRNDQAIILRKKLKDGYNEEVDFYSEKWEEAAAKAANARSKIPNSLRYNSDGNSKGSDKGQADAERRKQVADRLGQELVELQRSNDAAEIEAMQEGLKKKLREIENEYQARKNAIEKQESNWKRDNKKAGIATGDNGLTGAQSDALQEALKQAGATRDRRIADANKEARKEELQAMWDYLQEYGSIEQQKLAVTEEYEAKIKEAMSSGRTTEAARLTMEAKGKQDELSSKNLEEKIDWSGVFSDLRGHTREYLEGLRDQLQGVLSGGDLKPDQLVVVQEKIRSLNEEISKQGGLFQFVGDRTREHNRLLAEAADAQSRLTAARKKEKTVSDTITSQLENLKALTGKDYTLKDAGKAKNPFGANTAEYKKFNNIIASLKVSEVELGKARESTKKATKDAEQAEDASRRKSSQAVADWFTDAQQFISEKGIDQIPNLLSDLGLGDAGAAAAQGLQGFQDAAGAATDFMSGNYIGAAMKGVSAIKNFGEALGLWKTSNREEIEAANKKLEAATSANTAAIERLTEEMKNQSPTAAYKSWAEANALKQVNEANAKQTMENNARMYDGGHSLWYDFLENDSAVTIAKMIYRHLGKTPWDNSYDIGSLVHDLSGADWDRLLREVPDLMSQLGSVLADVEDDGNYNGIFKDILDFADEYSKEAYEDLRRSLQESVTGVSLDSFKDKFKDALMDISKASEDFCGDFTEMLMQSVLNARLEKLFGKEIEELYDAWSNSLSDDKLSAGEIEKLQGWQDDLVRRMMATRDELASATGYDRLVGSQSGRSGAFATMTQEQAGKLEGLFVNGQMHWANMDDNLTDVTRQMDEAGDHLRQIAQNTGSSASSLSEIKEDIKKMIRDGLKMK